jgi:hypothetical protein
MAKFNFLSHAEQPTEIKAKVRVRAVRFDRYAGLRGKAYIAARGLGKVQKLQTSAQTGGNDE